MEPKGTGVKHDAGPYLQPSCVYRYMREGEQIRGQDSPMLMALVLFCDSITHTHTHSINKSSQYLPVRSHYKTCSNMLNANSNHFLCNWKPLCGQTSRTLVRSLCCLPLLASVWHGICLSARSAMATGTASTHKQTP
jgi:hypothetical protein